MADINDLNYLEECFNLTERGELFWKVRPLAHFPTSHGCNIFNAQKAGNCADKENAQGYYRVRVNNNITMLSHRIIFFMTYGYLPEFVDHVDGNRKNNNPLNLRKATGSQNSHNTKTHRGSSKYRGVSWCKGKSVWRVFYTDASLGKYLNGKNKQVCAGEFSDEIQAALVYDKWSEKIYGDYAWLNRNNFQEVKERYLA